MQRRRLDQIDKYRELSHRAQRGFEWYRDRNDPEMAEYHLQMKTTLHKMAACLARREERKARALEALQRARMEEGA